MRASREPTSSSHRGGGSAIVVGAGASGCACAAVLAGRGVRVTLLNSALDRVNLPAYGPELVAGLTGWRELEETMALLPVPLRWAWLGSAAAADGGATVVVIDRRAVSIETKRILEQMPGLEFRQGLVTDLRLESSPDENFSRPISAERVPAGMVAVGTVFGEWLEAEAVILAVGLGLGGLVKVGEDSLHGGRYGEPPAEGLRRALERLGVAFGEAGLEVGASYQGDGEGMVESLVEANPGYQRRRTVDIRRFLDKDGGCEEGTGPAGVDRARHVSAAALARRVLAPRGARGDADEAVSQGGFWPESYPPAVHWSESFPMEEIVVDERDDDVQRSLVAPDGRATAEIHLSSAGERVMRAVSTDPGGSSETDRQMGAVASRLHHVVRAQFVQGLGPQGRLTVGSMDMPPIWVVGRAAGASSYLGSLRSGAVTGSAVARALLDGRGDAR